MPYKCRNECENAVENVLLTLQFMALMTCHTFAPECRCICQIYNHICWLIQQYMHFCTAQKCYWCVMLSAYLPHLLSQTLMLTGKLGVRNQISLAVTPSLTCWQRQHLNCLLPVFFLRRHFSVYMTAFVLFSLLHISLFPAWNVSYSCTCPIITSFYVAFWLISHLHFSV